MLAPVQLQNCAKAMHIAAHTATTYPCMHGTDITQQHTTARPQSIICAHLALILFLQVLHLLLGWAQASLNLHQLAR